MLARCIQHENDHLNGVTIMDRATHFMRMTTRKMRRIDPALYINFPYAYDKKRNNFYAYPLYGHP